MTRHSIDHPQFYLTAPAPCPYLDGRQERKVFTHLVGHQAVAMNDILTQGGFRRSQNIAYRPACEGCRACVSIRVRVDDFEWTRSFRRQWRLGAGLIGAELPPAPSSEQYDLFKSYLQARHEAGGMAEMSVLDYAMMVEDTHVATMVIEYRRRGPDSFLTRRGDGPLVAVALTDRMADGLSMVYSFYDPQRRDLSLGTFMILDHIERARRMHLPYVYLGYWVDGSPKMAYKERFRPQEHLGPDGWSLA
ncbi:arginyltransferase [Polymorphum gilvum]|uniref:Aspartate/glutamate leucyltransferase n=1 Tax=Polymorphum gilvum (strain LMG 25793 / CGMCC 1.9160 / SL003B-26A1) TaxID=991905 RepID=F2IWK5_POLGS|nr:arginyltransferase [Polymorphum gilvum]ADZ70330.1 Putative arginyl-tRNA--protein transferase [Polymorphum gilvum SL003B-26A1]